MNSFKLAASASLLFLLAACGKEGSEDEAKPVGPTPATATNASALGSAQHATPIAPAPVQKQVPTNVAADAVTVGASLQGEAALKSPSARFTLADSIYASASVSGKPAGATATVFWTYQDGTAHKQESKKLTGGQQSVWFSFTKADGMKQGNYNVEIDVDMKPIGIADFQVK